MIYQLCINVSSSFFKKPFSWMKLEYHTRVLKDPSDFVLYRYYILYILHLFFFYKNTFSLARDYIHAEYVGEL